VLDNEHQNLFPNLLFAIATTDPFHPFPVEIQTGGNLDSDVSVSENKHDSELLALLNFHSITIVVCCPLFIA
jgi:hypothetical protein